MENVIEKLQQVITEYSEKLNELYEDEWMYKPLPDKWSKKEILGHLIDSAQNNIRRFVVAQYEDKPKIVYAQETWVTAANYQNYNTAELLTLWVLLNKHICMILKKMPASATEKLCETNETHTIQWIAEDYNKHLLHHLHQVLDLEALPYP